VRSDEHDATRDEIIRSRKFPSPRFGSLPPPFDKRARSSAGLRERGLGVDLAPPLASRKKTHPNPSLSIAGVESLHAAQRQGRLPAAQSNSSEKNDFRRLP
jgi:hypothetical protein